MMEFDKGDVFRYHRWGGEWSAYIRRPDGTWLSGLEPDVEGIADEHIADAMERYDRWEYYPHAHQKRLGIEED